MISHLVINPFYAFFCVLLSYWTQAGGELTQVETQGWLTQLQYVIGPLGRLPFRLRSAPQVTNPRRHLDGPAMEEHGATQGQHSTPAQNT